MRAVVAMGHGGLATIGMGGMVGDSSFAFPSLVPVVQWPIAVSPILDSGACARIAHERIPSLRDMIKVTQACVLEKLLFFNRMIGILYSSTPVQMLPVGPSYCV